MSSNSPAATNPHSIGPTTGALLIVANMIGVGVFTTTGFMAAALQSPPAVLVAWLLGGVAALCGALSYAELGSALPKNGGEYQFLTRIYHPAVGFISGWASLVVGFTAPLAAFASAFGTYLNVFLPEAPPLLAGLVLIAALAVMHTLHVASGSRIHNVLTLGKIGLILAFIAGGLFYGDLSLLTVASERPLGRVLVSPQFPVQLVYVSFAYTGWNTAAYLAGEFRQPARDIRRAVLAGTAIVVVLYFGLNVVFLASAPMKELAGQEKVAHVAAVALFGARGGAIAAFVIMAGLISAASANIMAGPRVYEAMGRDYPPLRILAVRRAAGGPVVAIALQSVLAAIMLLTASFETLLIYIGVTLSLFAALTVLGVLVLRHREPDLPRPYRTWGYPVTPILFLAIEAWMIVFTCSQRPLTAAFGASTVVLGWLSYLLVRWRMQTGGR